MNKRLLVMLAALAVLTISAGIISAHYSDEQGDGLKEHYREMLDLHGQYLSGEISFNELWDAMGSQGLGDSEMPCHGGYGMMGYGMMW